MKKFHYIIGLLLFAVTLNAQYAAKHYIAPSPWQYWSNANEVVLSTKEEGDVIVRLSRSDGTFITTLTVTADNPVSYRFTGEPSARLSNTTNVIYRDRGLFVTATAPVLVNLRNIASDAAGTSVLYIKGNASLVSFGNEGIGMAFRLGYYRVNYSGLINGQPVYSVMAIENNTVVSLEGAVLATLDTGESLLFNAAAGALLISDKPVVANTGSYGDTPLACLGAGQDGAVDQIVPVSKLGMRYMLVRGNGTAGTTANHPEQSTIIASEPNTAVQITHFTPSGDQISTSAEVIANAGGFINIFHGDTQNAYSSTFISADKPVVIYSANAVDCETDISTVLPIGGCSGSVDISTRKFIDYNGNDLPYFGYVILESATEPVFINGQDMETATALSRVPIGTTGFYLLRFTNVNLGNPDSIKITSAARLTTSIIQQGGGFSMSAFFSAFSNAPDPPEQTTAENCSVTLSTAPGLGPYTWYLDTVPIAGATDNTYTITQTGNYSVSATSECGITPPSSPVFAVIAPPVFAQEPENMVQCLDIVNGNIFDLTTRDTTILGSQSTEDYTVTYHRSAQDAEAGVNAFTEAAVNGVSFLDIHARVTNNRVDCHAVTAFRAIVTTVEADMPTAYSFCSGENITITAPEGFLSYNWSTGETTPSIRLDESATVTLTVTQEVNGILCDSTITITATETVSPVIREVITDDWTFYHNSITIVTAEAGDFEYSTDGTTYQDSPVFENLRPGPYTVYARDKQGCGSDQYDVYLLMYPNFFTPNGDGVNETWKVKHAYLEPDMLVYIFDRYGKLISSFMGNSPGWDGTHNGLTLPATDYWFVVERADGRIHKGHFSMKR